MTHTEFLASISAEHRVELTERSDLKGLLHLVGHWGSIATCAVLISQDVLFWQALLVVQGVLLVFLFTLLHETSHKTPFATGWINTAVGHVCGLVLFLPATWFRYFHFAHHRYTQIPGKDPELEEPKPTNLRNYLVHISGVPVWISHAKTLFRNAVGPVQEDFVPSARRAGIRVEAICYLLIYASLAGVSLWFSNPLLVFVWLLPLVLGQPFLRLYLLAEHGRCPQVSNMLANTRTTFTNKMIKALAWNMPYHAEHHSFPAVPFHKLPDLHRMMAPHLLETEKGYLAFNTKYVDEELG